MRQPDQQLGQTAPDRAAEEIDGAPSEVTDGREDERLLAADLVIEDVSIDGMCGVY